MPLNVCAPQSTTMRQLGPCADGKSGAASGVNRAPPSGSGPYERPEICARFSTSRVWILPHVHFFESEPRRDVSDTTVVWNAPRITSSAFCAEPTSVKTGLVWSRDVHVSRSWPSMSLSGFELPPSLRSTLTLCVLHHGSNVAERYDCQKTHQIDAAVESLSMR